MILPLHLQLSPLNMVHLLFPHSQPSLPPSNLVFSQLTIIAGNSASITLQTVNEHAPRAYYSHRTRTSHQTRPTTLRTPSPQSSIPTLNPITSYFPLTQPNSSRSSTISPHPLSLPSSFTPHSPTTLPLPSRPSSPPLSYPSQHPPLKLPSSTLPPPPIFHPLHAPTLVSFPLSTTAISSP